MRRWTRGSRRWRRIRKGTEASRRKGRTWYSRRIGKEIRGRKEDGKKEESIRRIRENPRTGGEERDKR